MRMTGFRPRVRTRLIQGSRNIDGYAYFRALRPERIVCHSA
jgi:hypothetical protein